MEGRTTGKTIGGSQLNLLKQPEYLPHKGKKYARVTSIIGLMMPYEGVGVPDNLLREYGAMGTIVHGVAGGLLGRRVDLDEQREMEHILREGKLSLDPSNSNPKGFMDEYTEFNWNVSPSQVEQQMFNDDLMVSGTYDLYTTRDGSPCVLDWKTSRSYSVSSKERFFIQLGFYSLMIGKDVKSLVIAPLNPKNKKGYGKPIITEDVEGYQQKAINMLNEFNSIYRPNL